MNFNIGQRVVCVNANSPFTKKDEIYVVSQIGNCPKCKRALIDLGFYTKRETCAYCKTVISKDIQWFAPIDFRPLEYETCHAEIIQKFESPIERPDILEPKKIPSHEQNSSTYLH